VKTAATETSFCEIKKKKKKQSNITCGAGAAAGASESLGASDFCSD